MALILRRSWCCLSPGGSAELLEQLNERRALVLRQPTRRHIHHRLVTGEYPGRVLLARGRQPNDASPSVARVGLACDQAARLESIHSRGDRSAGELDSTTNLVYGLRSFVEKRLQDREVREALGRLDAAGGQARKRPMRFHQDQPQMGAGAVGCTLPWGGGLHGSKVS